MNDLVVGLTLPVFTGNFGEIKIQLLEGLKKYEIEVTEDNLSEAKKMATELNKLSTVLGKVKSEKVKEASAPVELFKTMVTELVDLCQAGREKILAQVKVFEDQTRGKCRELLETEILLQFNTSGIRAEFRAVVVDELVGISKVSQKGTLTKGAKDEVLRLVGECKALQDKVDMRLLQLENAGLKAGLKASLRKEHVESFLSLPDDQYDIRLAQLIGIEVARQAETTTKVVAEHNAKKLRYFACSACRITVTAHDLPPQCRVCKSSAFTEYSTLQAAQQPQTPTLPPPPPAAPPLPPPPYSPPPIPPAAVQWDQDRLGRMRKHLGDELFFQMFKIIYQPVSNAAIQDAIRTHPDLEAAIKWAKEKD